MNTRTQTSVLPNGIVIAAEEVPGVESAAIAVLALAGSSSDPEGQSGRTAVLAEMMTRGAGSFDARALIELQDSIGLEREIDATHDSLLVAGAVLARYLPRAVELIRMTVVDPRLAAAEFAASRELCVQSARSIEDAPAEKLLDLLNERALPAPYARSPGGRVADLERLSHEDILAASRKIRGAGIIAVVTGHVDPSDGMALLRDAFSELPSRGSSAEPLVSSMPPARDHIEKSTLAQVQIGMARSAIAITDPDYVKLALALAALSAGMSGRLFVELREKRGLVYAVRASYAPLRSEGVVYAYAAATRERVAETIEVLQSEFARLADGLDEDELNRAKAHLKSSVVMSLETPRARVATIASDLYRRGRVRPPEEILAEISGVSRESINAFLARRPLRDFSVVTYGQEWR